MASIRQEEGREIGGRAVPRDLVRERAVVGEQGERAMGRAGAVRDEISHDHLGSVPVREDPV